MNDSEIVNMFLERNERAIGEMSGKYGRYCGSIAQGILKNYEDAEECVNDAYMRAWESIPPQNPTSLKAYLAKITKNIALDRIKALGRDKRGGGELPLVYEELEFLAADTRSVEGELERKEMLAAVNRFLKRSSTVHMRAFVLRYWYCESVAEVARELGLRENHVAVILNRMRNRLRNYLRKEGYTI